MNYIAFHAVTAIISVIVVVVIVIRSYLSHAVIILGRDTERYPDISIGVCTYGSSEEMSNTVNMFTQNNLLLAIKQ